MSKKSNKKTLIFATGIISIILIVGLVFGIKALNKMQEQKAIETISAEFSNIIDANISAFLSRDESKQTFDQRVYGIDSVTYEITNIYKDNDEYVISVDVYVTTPYSKLNDAVTSSISHGILQNIFSMDKKTGISGDFRIAGYQCTYRPAFRDGVSHDERITVYVNDFTGRTPEDREVEVSTDKDAVKCQVCKKQYKKGSNNAKSINRTNMCSSCYANYKSMSDALNELPIG